MVCFSSSGPRSRNGPSLNLYSHLEHTIVYIHSALQALTVHIGIYVFSTHDISWDSLIDSIEIFNPEGHLKLPYLWCIIMA